MQRHGLGTGGPPVTPIGLGLAALGRPGYINVGHGEDLPDDRSVEGLERHAHAVLDHAFDRGVRYLDVARSYGRAEAFVASWLAADPARTAEVTVGSKWGYTYTAGWRSDADEHEVKDHTLATYTRQLAETRELLGDHLAVEQIHSATLDSGVLDDDAVLDALHVLSDSGVTVGLSLSGPGQARTLERALERTRAGRAPFRSVQATWNVLEPSVAPMLQAAHDAGWGVILKEVVANGRLARPATAPASVLEIAAAHGTGADAVAIAAALAQPFAHVVLSGAATRAQLDGNLDAIQVTLSPAEIAALSAVAEPPDRYWHTRSALPWT